MIQYQVLIEVVLNFVHFAWMKVSKMKSRVNLCSKSPFLPGIQIEETLNKVLKLVLPNLAKSFSIFQYQTKFCNI
jgi:hypothetical protein